MHVRFFAGGGVPSVTAADPQDAVRIAAEMAGRPMHDPPLAPRDEVIFLLTAAAEIEHVLMAQYLYAAYSVNPQGSRAADLTTLRDRITQIAREEMGHLVTVQNLLRIVGGPLHLDRDPSTSTATVAPFTFTLEPLTLDSLAKYVMAESPGEIPPDFPPADRELLDRIDLQAVAANGGRPVLHVGAIFERLKVLFTDELTDADMQVGTATIQAAFADWGYRPRRTADGDGLIVTDFPGDDRTALRAAAADAIAAIGAQGEGLDPSPSGAVSHFERFFALYKLMQDLTAAGVTVTWPVVTNPNTTRPDGPVALQAALDATAANGRITEPRARAWAQLFDLRYRLLLGLLSHFLHRDQPLYSTIPGPGHGDRTERGLLLIWTFDEMRHLSRIAQMLVRLPKDLNGTVNAGPPFGMPYTVALPEAMTPEATEALRWRGHLDVFRAAGALVRDQLQPDDGAPDADPFLTDVLAQDQATEATLASLADGHGVPPGALPAGFAKVVTSLEEAVRGFRIGLPHGNFWADVTRDQFVAADAAGGPPFGRLPDGSFDPDPAHSRLVTRVKATSFRMPLDRPPVPPERVEYLEDWVRAGGPDDVPPGRIGVHDERLPALLQQPPAGGNPPPGQDVGFAADVKPLFRESDRQSMMFAFDLFSYDAVRANAPQIKARLVDGTMPCDAPWPPERIATFTTWMDTGMAP